MSAPTRLTLESLVRLCADADPAPWYPSLHAKAAGLDRDSIDEPLARLRLAGLVRITDWEPGKGQGYVLTDAGRAILANPRALARLRAGAVPDAPAESPSSDGPVTTWERGEAVRSALLAPGAAPVTWLLIASQLVVFLAALFFALRVQIPLNEFLSNGKSPLLQRLGLWSAFVAAGEWWRLLTYAFVHAGALHLLFNLLSHQSLGPVAERMFGSVRLLVLWLLSALGGGCAVVLAGPTGAVGSSGAVCGLLGAVAAFVALNHQHLGPQQTAAWRRGLTNSVVLLVIISLMPGVSWTGHLGGGVVGLIAGALLNYHRFGTTWQRWAAVLGLVVLPVVCVGLTYRSPELQRQIDERNTRIARQTHQQELADLRQRFAPEIERAERLVNLVCFQQADGLIGLPPRLRDADQVRAAVAALATLDEELEAIERQVNATGPYQTEAVEQIRQVIGSEMAEQRQLVDMCRQFLQDTNADESRWREQVMQLDVAASQWRAHRRALRPFAVER